METDADVSRWVLELLLRDCHNDTVARRVLAASPLANQHSRFKKTVLLRTIESQIFDEASVTESLLDYLESIEALDRREGLPITDDMKAAYCAVATECTVKFLVCGGGRKPSGKYAEAVERIWRGRVRVLEDAEGCEMVTAEMRERRDEVEAGVWDLRVSERLASLDSRNEALRLVAAYVKEALAMLGPPFVRWAVRFSLENEGLGFQVDEVGVENDGNVGDRGEMEVRTANVDDSEVRTANVDDSEVRMANGGAESEVNGMEVQMEHGDDLELRMANGGSKLVVDGDNARDKGSELEAKRGVDVNSGTESEAQRANGANGSEALEREVKDSNVGDESGLQIVPVGYFDSMSETCRNAMNGIHLQVMGAGELPPDGNRGVLSSEPTERKETQRIRSRRPRHGPVKIRDPEDVDTEVSVGISNTLYSTEVREGQVELQSSISALKALVADPISYALPVSGHVRSESGMRHVDHVSGGNGGAANPSVDKNFEPDQFNNDNHGNPISHQNDVLQPSGEETDAANLSVDKGKGTEHAQMGHANPGNPSCSYRNNASKAGLMEHNSTAHTYEWDDSLDMSPEQTNNKGKLHLPSPKRNAVSPLKKYEDKRFARRRKIKRWSLHEEETLRTAVQKYGKGNWKFILETYRDVFDERTEVDLKDKWRNMTK